MKKTYQSPKLAIVMLESDSIMTVTSVGQMRDSGGDGTVLVKGDNSSSSSHYNVWDDDWSAE